MASIHVSSLAAFCYRNGAGHSKSTDNSTKVSYIAELPCLTQVCIKSIFHSFAKQLLITYK